MFVVKLTHFPSGEKLGAKAEPIRPIFPTSRAMAALRTSAAGEGEDEFWADPMQLAHPIKTTAAIVRRVIALLLKEFLRREL